MNHSLPIALSLLTAAAASGCFEETEPNNNHTQANRNNKGSYSKEAPLYDQGVSGELSDDKDVDIFYLQTTEPENNLGIRLATDPGPADGGCVWAQVAKCSEAGVTNWANCAPANRHSAAEMWSCPWTVPAGVPPLPFGQMDIGKNKLIRVKVHHTTTAQGVDKVKYVVGLASL